VNPADTTSLLQSPLAQGIGIWMAALLTLCIFSFLYRDNPFYKLAEHLFVGISAGYFVALEWHNVFRPNLWDPFTAALANLVSGEAAFFTRLLDRRVFLFIPFLLGLMLFSRFTKELQWLSRWAIAMMLGAFSGLAIIGFAQGDLVEQIRANMLPLATGDWLVNFNNLLLVVGVICTLIYFFYSAEHSGLVGRTAKLGIYFLMISFGASFGYTVMARVSLLIGRFQFLLRDWLGVIS
jgi:hypothetical protein